MSRGFRRSYLVAALFALMPSCRSRSYAVRAFRAPAVALAARALLRPSSPPARPVRRTARARRPVRQEPPPQGAILRGLDAVAVGSAPRAGLVAGAAGAVSARPSWRCASSARRAASRACSTGSGTRSAAADVRAPGFADVLEARRTIEPYLSPTPLRAYNGLSDLLGAEVLVKHENHLPTGAFKVRGGVNLVAHLTPEERRRGLVTASTGTTGSRSRSARGSSARARSCVPERANTAKVGAIRALGADIVEHGRD